MIRDYLIHPIIILSLVGLASVISLITGHPPSLVEIIESILLVSVAYICFIGFIILMALCLLHDLSIAIPRIIQYTIDDMERWVSFHKYMVTEDVSAGIGLLTGYHYRYQISPDISAGIKLLFD